jgi:hypothetical protein
MRDFKFVNGFLKNQSRHSRYVENIAASIDLPDKVKDYAIKEKFEKVSDSKFYLFNPL